MTLFLFPLPFSCLLWFDIDHTLTVRGRLQEQDFDENIAGCTMENLNI